LVDIDTADTNSFIRVVFIEKGEIVSALLEKLSDGLLTSSEEFISAFGDGVLDFK
jgi:hypothetical protein